MNKVAAVVLSGFVGIAVAIVAAPRGDYRLDGAHPTTPSAVASGMASSRASAAPSATAPEPAPSGAPTSRASDTLDLPVPVEEGDAAAAIGAGSGVPSLGDAPRSVTFGVVLVTYAGAQGAPRNARSRAEAETLAGELAELARADFRAAVKKGDAGSTDDAGKMYRGILEPGPEYALFSLEPEKVSAPVDTPRGYWIVRRIK